MPDFTVVPVGDISPEDRRVVLDGLVGYNTEQGFVWEREPLNVLARDHTGRIIGGLLGEVNLRWLFVSALWVDSDHRGSGVGSELMRGAEIEARGRACVGIYLDTFSFQARPFYEKLGFELFGALTDCPPGVTKYYLRKLLRAPA